VARLVETGKALSLDPWQMYESWTWCRFWLVWLTLEDSWRAQREAWKRAQEEADATGQNMTTGGTYTRSGKKLTRREASLGDFLGKHGKQFKTHPYPNIKKKAAVN